MKLPYHHPFGHDRFGILAERFARFFGTPKYIIGQTVVVACWIAVNLLWITKAWRFDPAPFILLNLVFSTQAAYAAPLILLAETRQADRDLAQSELNQADRLANHRWQTATLSEIRDIAARVEEVAEIVLDHIDRQEKS